MNKLPYIHNSKDINSLIKSYFLAIVPLILFGIYKNGLALYFNGMVKFKMVFVPIYFILVSIIVGFIVAKIFKDNKEEYIFISLISTLSISINTNLMIFPIVLFTGLVVVKYLEKMKKFSFNKSAALRIILILALVINSYSYLNISEKLDKFNYNLFDRFLGLEIGGIASTSILALIISFIILALNKYYKKDMAIGAIIGYFMMALIGLIVFKDYNLLLNGGAYFAFIFILPDIYNTPNHKKVMFLYGIVLGVIVYLLSLILKFEAPFIGILLFSLLVPLINKKIANKYLEG